MGNLKEKIVESYKKVILTEAHRASCPPKPQKLKRGHWEDT